MLLEIQPVPESERRLFGAGENSGEDRGAPARERDAVHERRQCHPRRLLRAAESPAHPRRRQGSLWSCLDFEEWNGGGGPGALVWGREFSFDKLFAEAPRVPNYATARGAGLPN